MKFIKNTRKIATFYMALILVAGAFFGIISGISGAEPVSASILMNKISDRKVEVTTTEGSKVMELVVEVTVQVDTAGEYVLSGDLSPTHIDSAALVKTYLLPGEHVLTLKFAGSDIYTSRVDGNYYVLLILFYDNVIQHKDTYETRGIYDHLDFKPEGTDLNDYTIAVLSNTVRLETDVLTAVIHEKTPVIEYYYTAEQEEAKFKVTYTRLIGYGDANSDGKFNAGDTEVYTADLLSANWDSNKVLFENFASFDFDITTSVTMESPQYPNVDIMLRFHYSSASYTTAAQRKFDIDIQIPDGQTFMGIDAIAIEHVVEDESAKDNQHSLIFDSEGDTLRFVDSNDKQHGYYSWLATADSNNNRGDITVGASTTDSDTGMVLYLSYAYDSSVVRIFHDPVIGIDSENIGESIGGAIDKILHHPAAYIISVLIAAAIVFGTLFKGRRK